CRLNTGRYRLYESPHDTGKRQHRRAYCYTDDDDQVEQAYEHGRERNPAALYGRTGCLVHHNSLLLGQQVRIECPGDGLQGFGQAWTRTCYHVTIEKANAVLPDSRHRVPARTLTDLGWCQRELIPCMAKN